MPRDLRVKAMIRPPRRSEGDTGGDNSDYSSSDVSSDEEWGDSTLDVMGQLCAHYFGLHVSARVRGSVVCLNLG
ncbi:hypothetical protein PI125_g17432 [Phytophthora idaei]|nr:hypothetical protein PI125_g17432 [Phytophthora idaei]